MDDLGALLMLLSFVGTIVGIVGLIKGNIKLFKLSSRKQVGLFILGCFVIFIIGGMMIDTGETDTLSTVGENIVQVERPDDTEGATETAALSQDESEQEEAQTAIFDSD